MELTQEASMTGNKQNIITAKCTKCSIINRLILDFYLFEADK